MDNEILKKIRKSYEKDELLETKVDKDPSKQLRKWLNEADELGVEEPNAMSIATVDDDGMPSSRIVLLRNISDGDLIFFTNYASKKGIHISNNQNVALLFFWPLMQRQVRIEGLCIKVSKEVSDDYFYSRPIESQIASIASPQSRIIENKDKLLKDFSELKTKLKENIKVERPEDWGGYRIKPTLYEFWQGGIHRLHDRLEYKLTEEKWKIERLAP